jgi:phosphatidylserine/phosphatidylglycerophosphate/cardiolipin synthase-like enzyme
MRLIIQPDDGVMPLIEGIDSAKKSVEIVIFRFDHSEIKHALERAVARGVLVRALIANTHHGEDRELRRLEMNLLPAGIEVARTSDDLLRYHYKFMIIDRKVLYLLTFNYTYLDIRSRSFGIVTENVALVRDTANLFEADVKRQMFDPDTDNLVISPIDARQKLSHFIQDAEHELLVYDPEIRDQRMIHLLRDRARAGVQIRIIGKVTRPPRQMVLHDHMRMRFHTRTIVRDRHRAFIGSQSLREAELDKRRELGLIIHSESIVHSIVKVFESDWTIADLPREQHRESVRTDGEIKKAAKAIVRELPLEPMVSNALEQAVRNIPNMSVDGNNLEHRIEDALRQRVEDVVSSIVKETVETEVRI